MRADSMRMLTCLALGAAALAGAAPPSQAQHAEPFRTRNLSPLISIYGVPVWRAPAAERELAVTSELANHFRLSRRGDDMLILDGETWRNGLDLRMPIGEGWFIGAELAHYSVSGGVLDDVVDAWHSVFGLPDGGRNNRAEDELRFRIANREGVFYDLDSRARGWGDLQLNFGRTLGADERLVLTGTLKLPTGDERLLAGSGATDWAVTLLGRGEREIAGRPAGGFWGIGVLGTGRAELIEFPRNELVPMAVVGGGWQPLPRIGFRAQLDVHRAFYRTRLEELGETSVQATLGGWLELGEDARLELAVNEDLNVSTSPDVVVHMALRWQWP